MTKGALFLAIGCSALVGGVVGGLTVQMSGRQSGASAKTASGGAAQPEASANAGDVKSRLDAIERSVSMLERERRLRAVSAANADDPGVGDGGVREPVVDDPVFETAVRDVLDRVESERTSERQRERAERRRKATERFASELSTELGLNETQKKKVLEIVQEYYEAIRRARENDGGAPLARREMRERMRSLRDKGEQRLGEVLSASQLEKYKSLDRERRLGFGRPAAGAGGE